MRNLIAAALIAAEGVLAWFGAPVAAGDSPCATLGGDVDGAGRGARAIAQ